MLEVGVLLTMDVEPTTATTHSSATGPADWDFGELAVRGILGPRNAARLPCDILRAPRGRGGAG